MIYYNYLLKFIAQYSQFSALHDEMAQKLPAPGKPFMITIILNGSNKQLERDTTIKQLLETLDLSEKRLAVEINQNIVPRSDFSDTILNEQDQVEIVQAIGGGQ